MEFNCSWCELSRVGNGQEDVHCRVNQSGGQISALFVHGFIVVVQYLEIDCLQNLSFSGQT